MQVLKIALLAVAVSFGTTSLAQTPGKTRAEVKAETRAAEKAGDVTAPGDSGQTLRQRFPEDYKAKAHPKPKKKKAKPAATPAQ